MGEMLEEMRQNGVEVVVCSADIAVAADVARVMAEADRMPPLRGVLHAAGVLDDGVLLQQTWPRFQQVLSPKVLGAWNLHEATRIRKLDFFVLFSSVAALLGTPGQGSYAAANAFLDTLAHQRRRLGLPAQTVNWGPWDEIGMAANLGEREQRRLAARGLNRLAPALALEALGWLLEQDKIQTCVLNADWGTVFRQTPAGHIPGILARLAPTTAAGSTTSRASLRTLLETISPEQGRQSLLSFVVGSRWKWPGFSGLNGRAAVDPCSVR